MISLKTAVWLVAAVVLAILLASQQIEHIIRGPPDVSRKWSGLGMSTRKRREGRQCMMAAIHCPRCHHRGAVALNRLPGRLRCPACGVTSLFRNGRAVQSKRKAPSCFIS